MLQSHVINRLVTIWSVILGFYTASFHCNSIEISYDQSEQDATCCCQANNVPSHCLGSCMNPFAKQYLHNVEDTKKNDVMGSLYTNKLFVNSPCFSYANIFAGCWKQIFKEQCCVELTILHENNTDEGKKLKFTGHYQSDIGKRTEENQTFSYTHNNGKHNLYKTKDGVWAIGLNQENNVTYISSCNTTCPEDCSTEFSLEIHKGDNPQEKMEIIIGCSTYPNTSDSVRACLRNFDYTKHHHAYLLPENCGEQKSGWKNSMAKVTVRHLGSHKKSLQKRPRKRGGYRARIIGGNDAKPMDYPWMAALHWPNTDWEKIWQCGGSIINDRYILTAAHCVKIKPWLKDAKQVDFVRLGEQTFNQTKDCTVEKEENKTTCADPPQDIDVEKIFIHPRFEEKAGQLYHDIALIRLKQKINFTDHIRPLCLPLDGDKEAILKGKPLKLAGWGFTDKSRDASAKPKILQEIDLTQRDSSHCDEWHQWFNEGFEYNFYDEGLICAGGDSDGGKDGCEGDSGSPLMVKNSAKNQVVQVGLMSGSVTKECGTPNITSYYTRVSYYLKWIMDNLRE